MRPLTLFIFVTPVHPHGCGEHQGFGTPRHESGGSSPRVWGTSIRPTSKSHIRRFIPTGVGNIRPLLVAWPRKSVHPHGCGEHLIPLILSWRKCGSSPRVWGTCCPASSNNSGRRFIPTGVGNIPGLLSGAFLKTVHPHGCGEHNYDKKDAPPYFGSSPRVWGTYHVVESPGKFWRFIPTGVGNILLLSL